MPGKHIIFIFVTLKSCKHFEFRKVPKLASSKAERESRSFVFSEFSHNHVAKQRFLRNLNSLTNVATPHLPFANLERAPPSSLGPLHPSHPSGQRHVAASAESLSNLAAVRFVLCLMVTFPPCVPLIWILYCNRD